MSLDLSGYPGGDLVEKGLADLGFGAVTEASLLVLIARPRLIDLGFEVPDLPEVPRPREHVLFERIEERCPRGAHAEYKALIARLVSFENSFRK